MQNKSLHMYYNLIIAQRGRDENFSTLSQKLQKLLQEFFPKGKILLVYRNSLVTQKLISFLRNEFADFENLFEIKNLGDDHPERNPDIDCPALELDIKSRNFQTVFLLFGATDSISAFVTITHPYNLNYHFPTFRIRPGQVVVVKKDSPEVNLV